MTPCGLRARMRSGMRLDVVAAGVTRNCNYNYVLTKDVGKQCEIGSF